MKNEVAISLSVAIPFIINYLFYFSPYYSQYISKIYNHLDAIVKVFQVGLTLCHRYAKEPSYALSKVYLGI